VSPQRRPALCTLRPQNERLAHHKEVTGQMTKLHRIAVKLLMIGVPAAFVILETAGTGHP